MNKTWKLEPLYVARNEQGVIVEVSETIPTGYELTEEKPKAVSLEDVRYRVIGD